MKTRSCKRLLFILLKIKKLKLEKENDLYGTGEVERFYFGYTASIN